MDRQVEDILRSMRSEGRFQIEEKTYQHGNTTVLAHSIRVAEASLRLAESLGIRTDREAMIRGALLHDYFLYDWHDSDNGHPLHGFTHGKTALKNAREDFTLNRKEEIIISRHMFPLTPVPPTCAEAWVVCMADKYCALKETAEPFLNWIGKRRVTVE